MNKPYGEESVLDLAVVSSIRDWRGINGYLSAVATTSPWRTRIEISPLVWPIRLPSRRLQCTNRMDGHTIISNVIITIGGTIPNDTTL